MNLEAMQARDNLKATRQAYNRGEASYDDMAQAAKTVLEYMQAAEKKIKGRVTTRITPASIASLLR
jgi:effector-binding domain-containing protein